MPPQRLVCTTFALIVLLCDCNPAFAYNDDGHFYTAAAIERSRQLQGAALTDARLVAFCAQLPDMADELDAVTLRVDQLETIYGYLWGAFSTCRGQGVLHMVTVHQYLHGFVDAAQIDPPQRDHPGQAVTAAAMATIADFRDLPPAQQNPVTDCAMGFAIHLLGDSFAHRTLRNPEVMYDPGMGHYDDGHYPDYIEYHDKYRDRRSLWVAYTQALATVLKASSYEHDRWQRIADLHQGGMDSNDFNTGAILSDLVHAFPDQTTDWTYQPALEQFAATDGCTTQYVLCRPFSQVVKHFLPQYAGSLRYETVWSTFKQKVVPEFEKQRIHRTCPDDGIH